MILKYLLFIILLFCVNITNAQDFIINIRTTGNNVYVHSLYFPETNITVCLTKRSTIDYAYHGSSSEISDDDYDVNAPEVTGGKINGLDITYYSDYEWEELRGKIKSIGKLTVTYYDRFGWDETKGKIKSIGNINFNYYDRFGWDETKGKLNSVGSYNITYYDRFDKDELIGKMKRIGNTSFSYYDRFDSSYKLGQLKSIIGKTNNLYVIKSQFNLNGF